MDRATVRRVMHWKWDGGVLAMGHREVQKMADNRDFLLRAFEPSCEPSSPNFTRARRKVRLLTSAATKARVGPMIV